MKSSISDRALLADCILAGGDIRDLAEYAINLGWSPRKFRVALEWAVLSDRQEPKG